MYGLTINPSKGVLGADSDNFLGFTVNAEGVAPLEERVKAIVEYKKPSTIMQLRRFLRMLNYRTPQTPITFKLLFERIINGQY